MKNTGNDLTAAVLGLAVGDAFGMPYECGKRGEFDVRRETETPEGRHEMRGFTPGMPAYFYKEPMPPGIWTDDTAMTLAEMESAVRLGRIDPDDVMRNFCRWHYDGMFSATGTAIGQGRQTLQALARYREGTPAVRCGGSGERDNGDGSLMRMLPYVFAEKLLARDGADLAALSSLTHAHPVSIRACELFVRFARGLLRGESRERCAEALAGEAPPFDRLSALAALPEEAINSSGYVVSALEAALWCFLTTEDYESCVLRAVNLGGDTDTVAAIAGGLAGLYYGEALIPRHWLDRLYRQDEIRALCASYYEVVK